MQRAAKRKQGRDVGAIDVRCSCYDARSARECEALCFHGPKVCKLLVYLILCGLTYFTYRPGRRACKTLYSGLNLVTKINYLKTESDPEFFVIEKKKKKN